MRWSKLRDHSLGVAETISCSSSSSSSRRLAFFVVMVLGLATLTACPQFGPPDGTGATPKLTGCPTEDVVVGESFTLTISVTEGELLGISTLSMAELVRVRTGPQSFTVTVTATEPLELERLQFFAATDMQMQEEQLECVYSVITDLGACCEFTLCEITDSNECFFRDGIFAGVNTTCDSPEVDCGVCEIDEQCPDVEDPCARPFCALGNCGERNICAGDGICDPANGDCPITIDVPFPSTIQNGETVDLVVNWSSQRPTNFRKTVTFGSAVGACPAGFSCPTRTITLENANPLRIPNAFTCRVDGATEPVAFLYEVALSDAGGLGSEILTVGFTCVP